MLTQEEIDATTADLVIIAAMDYLGKQNNRDTAGGFIFAKDRWHFIWTPETQKMTIECCAFTQAQLDDDDFVLAVFALADESNIDLNTASWHKWKTVIRLIVATEVAE